MNALRMNSTYRVIWNIFIVVLILASSWLIPFQIVFQNVVVKPSTNILLLINLFFLIDIFLNFFTSYRYEGTDVSDKKKIAIHYLKTFFIIDLAANLPLDALLRDSQDLQFYGISLVLVLRMLHLLRIVRLFVIFRQWEEQSWSNSGLLRIIKLFFIFIAQRNKR